MSGSREPVAFFDLSLKPCLRRIGAGNDVFFYALVRASKEKK